MGIPALPFCHVSLTASRPLSTGYPQELKTLGDHLRKRRLDLGLPQSNVARLLGVDPESVSNWERGYCSPRLQFIPRVIEFLGYVPLPPLRGALGENIVTLRRLLGLRQETLAHRLGVDPSTLAKWERGESRPFPGTRYPHRVCK